MGLAGGVGTKKNYLTDIKLVFDRNAKFFDY